MKTPTPSKNGHAQANGRFTVPPLEPLPNGDRDARGRFALGNAGGPGGNPFARRQAALRKALVEAVSEEDLHKLARTLLRQARAGDVAAAKLLLSYVLGQPAEAAHPDRLDLNELELLREGPSFQEMQTILGDCLPVGFAIQALQLLQPFLKEHFLDSNFPNTTGAKREKLGNPNRHPRE